jgi:hypothetical protein
MTFLLRYVKCVDERKGRKESELERDRGRKTNFE